MKKKTIVLVTLVVSALSLVRAASAESTQSVRTLSLPEALAEIDRQSPTMAQVRARADEASSVVRQAKAALLPTLVATGNYTHNSDQVRVDLSPIVSALPAAAALADRLPGPLLIQPLDAWTAGGALRVPLVVPSAWYEVSAAKYGEEGARAAVADARLRIRTGFAQAAYAAVAAEQIVTASEKAVEVASEHARSAERGVLAGTVAPLAGLRAKTEVVRRESDLARARAELDRARLGLGILIGRTEPIRVSVPELEDSAGTRAVTEADLNDALSSRPDRVLSRAQIDAALAQKKSAAARFFPQLSASGAVNVSDTPFPTGKKEAWRITLDLSWTLYDGGLRYGKQKQADAALRVASSGAQAERLTLVQQVEDARRDIEVARERLKLAVEQVKLASDAAGSAKRTFEAGVASNLDVLDANDQQYQADVALADARARLAQAVWSLERALGRAE